MYLHVHQPLALSSRMWIYEQNCMWLVFVTQSDFATNIQGDYTHLDFVILFSRLSFLKHKCFDYLGTVFIHDSAEDNILLLSRLYTCITHTHTHTLPTHTINFSINYEYISARSVKEKISLVWPYIHLFGQFF